VGANALDVMTLELSANAVMMDVNFMMLMLVYWSCISMYSIRSGKYENEMDLCSIFVLYVTPADSDGW